jgi:hypothetical protein
MLSASPPANGVFTWVAATGVLTVDIHQTTIAALARGAYTYEITVIKSNGVELAGPSGAFVVSDAVTA